MFKKNGDEGSDKLTKCCFPNIFYSFTVKGAERNGEEHSPEEQNQGRDKEENSGQACRIAIK